jgi:hypothetical protein
MIILRIISGFFIVCAFVPLAALSWMEPTPFVLSGLAFSAVINIVVAVGLIKLMPWARWVAIILISLGFARALMGGIRDINFFISQNVDILSVIFAAIIMALLSAICAATIWWLYKASTKALFNSKSTQ